MPMYSLEITSVMNNLLLLAVPTRTGDVVTQFKTHLDAGYSDYIRYVTLNRLINDLSAWSPPDSVNVDLTDAFGVVVDRAIMREGLGFSYMPVVTGDYTLRFSSPMDTGAIGITRGNAWADVTYTSSGTHTVDTMYSYSGSVAGIANEYIYAGSENLNITATSPNVFLKSGSGMDGLTVTVGNNVLDGGAGSNFLTGGSGNDTFYTDAREMTGNVWSTLVNFHAGDSATIWGITPQDHTILTLDERGAPGYTGLTLVASAAGSPDAGLTIAGYTSTDLSNGRLTTAYGRTQDLPYQPGSPYWTITAH